VVTVEEALRGRLAKVARAGDGPSRIHQYALLEKTIQFINQFQFVSYDQRAENEFQQLHPIRIGTQDRKIASIALANKSLSRKGGEVDVVGWVKPTDLQAHQGLPVVGFTHPTTVRPGLWNRL